MYRSVGVVYKSIVYDMEIGNVIYKNVNIVYKDRERVCASLD